MHSETIIQDKYSNDWGKINYFRTNCFSSRPSCYSSNSDNLKFCLVIVYLTAVSTQKLWQTLHAVTFLYNCDVYKNIHFWYGNESENPFNFLISNFTKNAVFEKMAKNHFFGKKKIVTS